MAGIVLESALALPEAVPASLDHVGVGCVFEMLPSAHLYSFTEDPWLLVADGPMGYTLRFRGLAEFEVSLDGARIRCRPDPDLPQETLRHLLLDHVVPRALSLRGHVVLHGSAVTAAEGALLFLGESGWGKSTLATALAVSGLSLLADDAVVVEEGSGGVFAWPTYPGFRLWPADAEALLGAKAGLRPIAHYTEKVRLGLTGLVPIKFAASRAPVRRLFVLSPPGENEATSGVRVERLGARDAFLALWRHGFRIHAEKPSRVREQFARLTTSALLPMSRRVSFLRHHAALPEVCQALLADAAEA